ncbi:hypothetical protein BLX88_25455, partial [Bacillus obstructivus]
INLIFEINYFSKKNHIYYITFYINYGFAGFATISTFTNRSEERREGEEGRNRGGPDHLKKKKTIQEDSRGRDNT